MAEDWLTTVEAAEISGYHVIYLRQLIRDGKIEARKFGPVWQVNRQSLTTYIKIARESGDRRRGPKE
jgi:excisionase family DNA binding protein